eukprot:SAG31_NODE_18645_length_628_cov_0.920605_2_plen_51_part_01
MTTFVNLDPNVQGVRHDIVAMSRISFNILLSKGKTELNSSFENPNGFSTSK